MKSMSNNINKIYEGGLSKDGKSCRIENIKIKQSSCPMLIKLLKDNGHISNVIIKSCRLKVLPNEISSLGVTLKRLHIEDNKIQEIPNMESLNQLEELILANNEIAKFQVSISKLPTLRVLDLSTNQLGTIPVRLFGLVSMRELYLDYNQFSHFPSHLCELIQLSTLGFSGNLLKSIPAQIGAMSGLKKLVLSGNQLESVPVEICNIKTLNHLDISLNILSSLPCEYGQLVNLEFLYLQHNKLRTLPDEIGQCQSLISLRLNNNTITQLPSTIGQLGNLSELYLQENRLNTLPKEISQCCCLKKLYLEYNKLVQLPDQSIKQLNTLNVLTLHDNLLDDLPSFLTLDFTHHLIRFTIHNNPFLRENNIDVIDSLQFLNYHLTTIQNHININSNSNNNDDSNNTTTTTTTTTSTSSSSNISTIFTDSSYNSPLHSTSFLRSPSTSFNNSNGGIIKKSITNSSINSHGSSHSSSNGGIGNGIHPTPKLNFKSLITSRDFSSEESDSDTDSTSSYSYCSTKRSSLSPRTSLTLSNSASNDSVSTVASNSGNNGNINNNNNGGNGGNGGLVNSISSLSLSNGQINYYNISRARRGTHGSGSDGNNVGGGGVGGISPSPSNEKLASSLSSQSLTTPRQQSFLNSVLNRRKSNTSNNNLTNNNNNNPGLSMSSGNLSTHLQSSSPPGSSSSPSSSQSYQNLHLHSSFNGLSTNHHNQHSSSPSLSSPLSSSSSSNLVNSSSNGNIANLNGSGGSTGITTPPASPIYKSFQSLYETLLDDLDYSKKRREELLNLTCEEKWIFLQRIKPDCTNSLISNGVYQLQNQISSTDLKTLISSPPKLNSLQHQQQQSQQSQQSQLSSSSLPLSLSNHHHHHSSVNNSLSCPKSPRSYLKVLYANSLFTFEDISKLRQQLVSKPVSWVINFAESTGIISILSMISTYSTTTPSTSKVEDNLIINECLICIKLLVELSMQSLLLHDTADIIIPLTQSNVLSTKRMAFEVLELICKTFTLGSTIVLEAIKNYSKKSKLPITKVISFITIPLDGEYAADLKVNCMSLINHLINSANNGSSLNNTSTIGSIGTVTNTKLENRIDIRSKFLSNDILVIIKNLRIDGEGVETSSWKQLELEMKQFESMMVQDDNHTSNAEANEDNTGSNNNNCNNIVNSNSNSSIISNGGGNSSSSLNNIINSNGSGGTCNSESILVTSGGGGGGVGGNGGIHLEDFESPRRDNLSSYDSISNTSNTNNNDLVQSLITPTEGKLVVIVSMQQSRQQVQSQQQLQQQLQDEEDDDELLFNPNTTISNSATAASADVPNTAIQTREVIVSVSRKSQAGDVIRSLLSSNSNLKELGEWGLYVLEKQTSLSTTTTGTGNNGRFLKDDEYIFDLTSGNSTSGNTTTANTTMGSASNDQDGATPRSVRSIPRFREYRLKMIPWRVRISLEKVREMGLSVGTTINESNKWIAEAPMDPTMTCAGLVFHLIKKYLPLVGEKYCLESDDFGLYLDTSAHSSSSSIWSGSATGGTSGGYWLEPLEKLHDYEIFKDPKMTVALKLRPKGVKLKFADGTFEIFRLDLMSLTEKIFQEISEKVIDSNNNINLSYYGIFVDRQIGTTTTTTTTTTAITSESPILQSTNSSSSLLEESKKARKPEWLEKGLPLYHYKINNRCCLRFALRPSNITLLIDVSLFNNSKFKQQQPTLSLSNNNNNSITNQNILNLTSSLNLNGSVNELSTSTTQLQQLNESIDGELLSSSSEKELTSSVDLSNGASNVLLSKFQQVDESISNLKFELPQPIQSRQIIVQLPLHLPLGEALETDENWIETGIDREKCSFHFDSFDGLLMNQTQPLNTQNNFNERNKICVLMADELEINSEQINHNKTNIWDEPFDSSTIICDPDNPGQIRAATLNKLLEQATNNIEKDRELMNILLMTYMSFATSDILLDKLVERYNVPDHEKDQKSVVQLHTIVFLKNWLEQQAPQAASGGGLEEKFLVRLEDFVDKQITNDGYTRIVPQLKKWIDSALKEKRAYAMPEAARPNQLTKLPSLTSSLLDDELFVAQQLTLREYETFKRIQAVEFLGQAWGKPKLQYKAPNLLKMIERFNKISTGVSTAILSQPKIKTRVKLICRFIKIAQHCRDLNNYHLLTAFMAGIRNSNVVRLRLSWAKVPRKHLHILEDLEKIMSMEGSFKEFRTKMAETIPPCIPYLGVYLKDLTFIEEGNPDSINSLINWGKKKLIYNIISIVQRCQQVAYDFGGSSHQNNSTVQKSDLVLNYFDSLPIAVDELLYKISLNLEPRQSVINNNN